MIKFSELASSSIGKKLMMGSTGILLSGFIIFHIYENIALVLFDGEHFNRAVLALEGLGALKYVAEFILAALFVFHIIYAIWVTISNWMARNNGYKMETDAGHTSRKTFASSTMIWTGLLVFAFLIWHLIDFKYGAFYTTVIDGETVRDLHRTVIESYHNIYNVIFYVVVLGFLGFHLSHGVWSAFQSLGIDGKRFTPAMVLIAFFFSVIATIIFVVIPIYIYLTGGTI